MAQTKRKTKHRGNAAGVVESRGRTGRKPTAEEKKRNRKTSTTSSREMAARFDAKTGKVQTIEQTGDFVYDEDDRHARAAKATLDQAQDTILLQTSARMWDSTGSTSAGRIRMNENTGDFTAEEAGLLVDLLTRLIANLDRVASVEASPGT